METREKSFSLFFFVLFFVFFLIFILLQFLAPLFLPSNSVDNLSGMVGIYDNQETISKIPGPWNSLYSIGDRLCHQISERSFYLNGNQMPFCARCTGIWLGIAIGLGYATFFKINLDKKFLYLIIIGLIPIGIDGVGQTLEFWESTNVIRVLTGLFIGVICGLAIGVLIEETGNIVKDYRNKKKKKEV